MNRNPPVDRGSIIPIMAAVLVVTVMSITVTARLGGEVVGKARVEVVAESVALALSMGDREAGNLVAAANGARIIEMAMSGDSTTGFDATATVEKQGLRARARASTRDDSELRPESLPERAVPGSGTGVLR